MGKHTAATADPTTDYGSAHSDAVCSTLAENPSFGRILAAQTPTVGDSVTNGHLRPYLVAIGATTLAALATCYPAVAHADEASFLQELQSQRAVNNPSTALAVGHDICDDITANGVAGVEHSMGLAKKAGIAASAAGDMLYASVHGLCPNNIAAAQAWSNNTGTSTSQTPILGTAAGAGMPLISRSEAL
jgi:hypothetical protein